MKGIRGYTFLELLIASGLLGLLAVAGIDFFSSALRSELVALERIGWSNVITKLHSITSFRFCPNSPTPFRDPANSALPVSFPNGAADIEVGSVWQPDGGSPWLPFIERGETYGGLRIDRIHLELVTNYPDFTYGSEVFSRGLYRLLIEAQLKASSGGMSAVQIPDSEQTYVMLLSTKGTGNQPLRLCTSGPELSSASTYLTYNPMTAVVLSPEVTTTVSGTTASVTVPPPTSGAWKACHLTQSWWNGSSGGIGRSKWDITGSTLTATVTAGATRTFGVQCVK